MARSHSFSEKSFLTLNSVGFSKIVYSVWGQKNQDILICVHGLTGNGHDFNWIAPHLAEAGYQVVAIDLPGRGRSDFLENPLDYCYWQYLQDLTTILAHLGVNKAKSIDWLGVSLGGLLGIRLACLPNTPIRKIILNDIGPHVPEPDLDFIREVLAKDYEFPNFEEFTKAIKALREPNYGALTNSQWSEMAQNIGRKLPNGNYSFAFDPAIRDVFNTQPVGERPLWTCWDKMDQPALVLRGASSTIFPQSVAEEMRTRGPGDKMTLRIIEGCGHVPPLISEEQISLVKDWLIQSKT